MTGLFMFTCVRNEDYYDDIIISEKFRINVLAYCCLIRLTFVS